MKENLEDIYPLLNICIQICKLFAALLKMESLAPETRGCRFQGEADQLKFHSRFLHLCHFSAWLFLFIHSCSSQPSSWYWWLSRPIFPCSFFVCPPISSPSSVSFPLLEFAPPPPPLLLPSPPSLLSLPVTPINPCQPCFFIGPRSDHSLPMSVTD